MTKLQRELTSDPEQPFRIAYETLDMLGCYGLKRADTYWKGLINSTYTLESLVPYFQGAANPLVRKGLSVLQSQNPSGWSVPKPYRDLFLAKSTLVADPEETGIHLFCLDKVEYITIRGFTHPHVPGLPDETPKEAVGRYVKTLAKPGLNILLSCSQSDVIKVLNDTNLNKTKGPSQGYYYLGFDKNIHYLNNMIIMPTGDSYSAELEALAPIQLTNTNTSQSYLNRLDTSFQTAIQTILSKGAVYFTTENILNKFKVLAAHIETAAYRVSKKQSILPKEVGLFKLEDGTVYSPEAFAESVKTQGIAPLRNNTGLRSNLTDHVQLRVATPAEQEIVYKKKYTTYVESKEAEIAAMPRFKSFGILDYVATLPSMNTWKKKLEHLQYLLEFPEGKQIVADWVDRKRRQDPSYNYNYNYNSGGSEEDEGPNDWYPNTN